MDGVLVDASESYRRVVVETVRRFCVETLGCPEPAVNRSWVEALKRLGGFNNDWDLSAALVRGVYAGLSIESYSLALQEAGGGMAAVNIVLGPSHEERFSARGPIQALFQELYLGGYRDEERALLSLDTMAALRRPIAVATGRPRSEAQYALRLFQYEVDALVTHDDAVEAGQPGKPDPWVLLEAARRLFLPSTASFVYVGDTPDDMRAAGAAGFAAIGVCASEPSLRAELRAAGADLVLDDVNELADHGFCA